MDDFIALDWAALVALALALVHLAAPHIRPLLAERIDTAGVMGSGMAVGYVFIHLFNEIDSGHKLLGHRIHLVMLIGFFVYFWVEPWVIKGGNTAETRDRPRVSVHVRLAFGWLYGWLLLYVLPDGIKTNGLLMLPPLMAIGAHLLYEDFHQAGAHTERFDRLDRFILATGPIAGWLTDLFFFADDAMISDTLTAFLAGSVLYKVFSREVPRDRKFSMLWFAAGVVVFVLLDGIGR